MKMGDSDNKMAVDTEAQKAGAEVVKAPGKPEAEGREVEKTKVSVDLQGIETTEEAEAAEVVSGKVSEKEQKAKDQYAGTSGTSTQAQAIQATLQPIPPSKVMKAQVKRALKKEIKDLHKKINRVINKGGNMEAHKLNTLMAKLRRLREMLAAIAHATSEFIKDLWMRLVKEKKSL
jgi:hypothetical protein